MMQQSRRGAAINPETRRNRWRGFQKARAAAPPGAARFTTAKTSTNCVQELLKRIARHATAKASKHAGYGGPLHDPMDFSVGRISAQQRFVEIAAKTVLERP